MVAVVFVSGSGWLRGCSGYQGVPNAFAVTFRSGCSAAAMLLLVVARPACGAGAVPGGCCGVLSGC